MAKQHVSRGSYVQPYRYPSPNIPMRVIRRFARQIAERFHPEKIILFGSYAYGTPHVESDVDLLVIMPAYDAINQSIRISLAFDHPFSLDLIVRTPKQVERGLKDSNWFLQEVIGAGKILYEVRNGEMSSQGRGGLARGVGARCRKAAPARSGVFPLPASGRKVPKSPPARSRRRCAKDS
jgi:predicted nucleotidyltransferase